jgi:hypothetical protein
MWGANLDYPSPSMVIIRGPLFLECPSPSTVSFKDFVMLSKLQLIIPEKYLAKFGFILDMKVGKTNKN